MNTRKKVVAVRGVHDRPADDWLLLGFLVLIGSALACWTWWLFE